MTKGSQIAMRGLPPKRSALASGGLALLRNRTGGLARMAAVWHAAMNLIAPLGYEDESGFHLGEMPDQTARIETS